MTTFETTVLDTFQKLTDLTDQIKTTESGFTQLKEYLSQVLEQVDQEWSTLEQRANSLLSQVNIAKDELTTETEQMVQALSQLQEKVITWQQETEKEHDQTQTKINIFIEQIEVSQTESEEIFQKTDEVLIRLKDKTEQVEIELTAVLTESQDALEGEFSIDLKNHQSEIEQQVSALEACIMSECLPQTTDQLTDFVSRLDQVVRQLSVTLEQIGEGTQLATTASLDSLNELRSQYEQLIEDANRLEGNLQGVAQRVEQISRAVSAVIYGLEEGVETTGTGAMVVIGILNDTLASYEEAKSKF